MSGDPTRSSRPRPAWTSLTSADLLVSLRVPVGWDATVVDERRFLVQGEGTADYRPTLSVQGAVPEDPDDDWFADFSSGVTGRLAAEVPGIEILDTQRFRLSSLAAQVVLVQARGHDPELPATSQVQAWVWAGPYRMLVLGGSTLLTDEARDQPVLEEMIRSVRLLPPRLAQAPEPASGRSL